MALLELKSDLSKFRIPKSEPLIDKNIPYKVEKTAYNKELLIPNNKIPKFESISNTQSFQPKTLSYKRYKIGQRYWYITNRILPITNTTNITSLVLPKIDTTFGSIIEPKKSLFYKILPNKINFVSTFKKVLTTTIEKVSTFVKILPNSIKHISSFEKILPKLIIHPTNFIKILPKELDKTSLFIKVIRRMPKKPSPFIKVLPKEIPIFTNFIPAYTVVKLKRTDFVVTYFDNSSRYLDPVKIKSYIQTDWRLHQFYTKPIGDVVTNYFDNLKSGAIGFSSFMRYTMFIGIDNQYAPRTYIYPGTVQNGRAYDLSAYNMFYQAGSYVTFRGNVRDAKYKRTYYTWDNPYVNGAGQLTNTEYSLYNWSQKRRSPSPLELIYTSYNLKDASYNPWYTLVKEPYIITGIQRKDNPKPEFLSGVNVPSIDLIRGGIVGSTRAAALDVLRIGSFLSSPKGVGFILKQIGLQKANPKTAVDALTRNNRSYDPLSVVKNIATQHLGIRFRRDGNINTKLSYNQVYGINGINNEFGPWKDSNILLKLKRELITFNTINVGTPIPSLSGLAGPQSVYGLGATTITRAVNSKVGFNKYDIGLTYSNSPKNDFNTLKKTKISPTRYSNSTDPANMYYTLGLDKLESLAKQSNPRKIINFLLGTPNNFQYISTPVDYNSKNIHIDYGIPFNPPGRNLKDINKSTIEGIDKINVTRVGVTPAVNDIIKFKFSKFPNGNESLYFRPFIVMYSETYSPEWKAIHIVGRSDNAYIHSNFERTVNITFKVACFSKEELKPIWEKLNKLANFTMPEYNEDLSYRMKGPLTNITLGDLLVDVPCFISALTYDLDEDTTWEIQKKSENNKSAQVPKVVTVSLAVTILNKARPTNSSWNYGNDVRI